MGPSVWQVDPANITPYYNLALCEALSQAGWQGHYVTSQFLYDKQLPASGSFTVDYLYFRGLNDRRLLNYPRLRRLLRAISYPFGHWQLQRQLGENRPDIVHIQWNRLPRLDYWLAERIRALGIPIVYTVHDVIPMFNKKAIDQTIAKIYEKADGLIVHTVANRDNLLIHYPHIDPSRIHIIPHIVPMIALPKEAVPTNATQQQARQYLGLPDNTFVFLFFGSIRPYKGLDILIPAFLKVLKQQPTARLIIAGRPEGAQDTALLEPIREHPNVNLYTNYIPYEEMWLYHFAADVMVFPYRDIYQSGALITGMGFGKPVIVTNVGGLPETIDGNGWIVPSNDTDALASIMIEAATNRERLASMGKRSLALINEQYAGPVVAKKLTAIYEMLKPQRES